MPGAQHLLSGGDRERIGVNVCAFEQLKGGGAQLPGMFISVYILLRMTCTKDSGVKSPIVKDAVL